MTAHSLASKGTSSTTGIDGTLRPTTNSLGQALATTAAGLRQFWQWFGDSHTVDDQGRPLVFFHGCKTPDGVVDLEPGGRSHSRLTGDSYGVAVYLTTSPSEASFHAGDEGAVFPVYVRGDHLDFDAALSPSAALTLTSFAKDVLLPSDKARFSCGRARRTFTDVSEARDFFDVQRSNWQQFGDNMDRAKPEALVEGNTFVVEYTDFDAAVAITNGDHAFTLFRAVGFDNLPAAGFDGLIMSRDGGARWAVVHRPAGNLRSAVGNFGLTPTAARDLGLAHAPRLRTAPP